jgi:hypothetical protein
MVCMSDNLLLRNLLKDSNFNPFLGFAPTGVQLPSFIATVCGLKPAMDLWIRPEAWQAFVNAIKHFGLYYHLDTYFDLSAEHILKNISSDRFTTTRAVLSKEFHDKAEAHVFIARDVSNLKAAVGAGWYPLVVENEVVDKHPADHEKFGIALGYPKCCQDFFYQRNNWRYDNTYFAAYQNTLTSPVKLSNGLLRHTAFSFIPHMPCSFSCEATIGYGQELKAIIREETPSYGIEIERRLGCPALCLSELRIYRFEGATPSAHEIQYESVDAISPTNTNDSLYEMLMLGDSCEIDGNIVRVYKNGSQINAYMTRADRHGPEFPFIVHCVV